MDGMRRKILWAWTAGLALAFVGWSYATLHTTWLAWLDASSATPGPAVDSAAGQYAAALALVFEPLLVYTGVVVAAVVAYRGGNARYAVACLVTVVLGWSIERFLKAWIARPRPDTRLPLITAEGFAYPSGHMVAITAVVVLALVAWTARRRPALVLAEVVGAILVVLVGWNRWFLRAHYLTDIVGGALAGAAVATLCLAVCDPAWRTIRRRTRQT